jgi:phage anti-repressor protein
MTQIIKPESVDFNALIKNSTILNLDCQSKMIETLNKEFTEEESRWYIANLYVYMNYHPTNDYPINLETLVKLVGFAHKKNAKRTLENNFTKDEDYKITVLPSEQGKFATEEIMLNVDTFKNMCMLVKTEKSKEIRKYYVKLENIYNGIVKKEIENTQILLQQKETQLQIKDENINKLTKEKMMEKHNILLREFGNIGSIVYIIKVKTFQSGEYIIKIGESRRGVLDRYNEHKNNYKNENVEDVIVLDCFIVKNSKNFETFLHNQFKNYKVKDLHGHQNENELFLIGRELSYLHVLNIINQNIKYYNDDYSEIEKLRLENLNLIKIQELNKDVILKDFMKIIIDNNEKLYNKIDNLENTINGLKSQINSITTKTTTNFNEPLVTLGPRLQKINPETLQLIKVYESVSECIKENTNIKRPSLNKAVIENTIYQGYRWMLVDRLLDQNKIYNIKETKVTRIQNTGYIAKLNKDKTRIVNVYLDRKTATKLNDYVSPSSLDVVVKKCLLSNEHYYILYDELDEILKEKFTKPVLYKNGVGKFDNNGNLIKEFTSKEDARIKEQISNKTLNKALDAGNLYGNYYYKFIGNKLQC